MWTWINFRETFLITHNGLKLTFPPRTLRVVEENPRALRLYNHVLNITLFHKGGSIYAFIHEARLTYLLTDIPPPLRRKLLGD